MSEWVRLKRRTDWGRPFYTLPDSGLNEWGTLNGWRAAVPEKVSIRWPNGDITTEEVQQLREYYSVGDHGNTSSGFCPVPTLALEVHGARVWLKMDEVEVIRSEIQEFKVE